LLIELGACLYIKDANYKRPIDHIPECEAFRVFVEKKEIECEEDFQSKFEAARLKVVLANYAEEA
jgi:hypothetical protein